MVWPLTSGSEADNSGVVSVRCTADRNHSVSLVSKGITNRES